MRGTVPGLPTPHPIGQQLPAILQEDAFAMRWTAGLDDVLAPVVSVLDCLDAYVDPALSPTDFAHWLAGWVGAELDETWSPRQQRRSIAAAVSLHRARGTVAGLRAQLELATSGSVEISDGGGVTWAVTPLAAPTDAEPPHLRVTVTVAEPDSVRLAALDSLVAAAKPAYLPHTIEVIRK